MHLCDNPPCYNVNHLKVGTTAENNADMARKGRSRNQNSKKTFCGICGGSYGIYISPVTGKSIRRCFPCFRRSQDAALARRKKKRVKEKVESGLT